MESQSNAIGTSNLNATDKVCYMATALLNALKQFEVRTPLKYLDICLPKPFEKVQERIPININKIDLSNRNEGEISFSNLAVWLIVYQMLNKEEKDGCVAKIAEKSGEHNKEGWRYKQISNLLQKLGTTENIKQLIQNYGTEGISIEINSSAVNAGCINNLDDNLLAWLKERGFLKSDCDLKKVSGAISDGGEFLKIEMKKDIHYQWQELGLPLDCSYGNSFCGEKKKEKKTF